MRMSIATRTVSAAVIGLAVLQVQILPSRQENTLDEYVGVYEWDRNAFVYLQLWSELTGTKQLVAFDESGEVHALYPDERDRFTAGPAAAIQSPVESRIVFQRDPFGKVMSLTWQRESAPPRTARRANTEKREDVHFSNDEIRLGGTLITPNIQGRHPALILVHASGAEDREYLLPFTHFLVRRGIAVLGYDKRGVGESTGDWKVASFEDLAGDVVAAFEFLKKRSDIDAKQIGVLGWSQAGLVMPLAAVHAKDIAFLISISGAGVPVAETTLDETRNEMTARGMRPHMIEPVIAIMKLQYRFAQTGKGWQEYATARENLAARFGRPPDNFPGTPDDPYWEFIRRLYFYDPAPTLRQLKVPTLAILGELDTNILPDKNRTAWETALKSSGNRDYTLVILPKADHLMLEAKTGSNQEMPSLHRFVPAYLTTIDQWLAAHLRSFRASHRANAGAVAH
jgi:uncharacterized protein